MRIPLFPALGMTVYTRHTQQTVAHGLLRVDDSIEVMLKNSSYGHSIRLKEKKLFYFIVFLLFLWEKFFLGT